MSNPFKKKYRERKRNNNNKTPARHWGRAEKNEQEEEDEWNIKHMNIYTYMDELN